MKQAVCCSCGREVPMGDDYGRIDMRMMTSEHPRDAYGARKSRRTTAVLTGTVCLECLDSIAHGVSSAHGIPMRVDA